MRVVALAFALTMIAGGVALACPGNMAKSTSTVTAEAPIQTPVPTTTNTGS